MAAPPPGALTLTFTVAGKGRALVIEGPETWRARLPELQDV